MGDKSTKMKEDFPARKPSAGSKIREKKGSKKDSKKTRIVRGKDGKFSKK